MKIVHKSKKPVPPVAEFIKRTLKASNEELTAILSEVDVWKWPRSDLNAWIKVLNKFDAVLEEIIAEYDLDKLQLKTFSPSTKRLVSEILRFKRLLMENSTNRKTYNSYDRLNSLLFTSDLDILLLTLNLLLRPAQQYSAQPAVSHALSLSSGRLQSLAKKWPHVREYGAGLVDLVSPKGDAEVESLPVEAREVNMTFYRTDGGEKTDQEPQSSTPAVPETPRKGAAPFPSSEAVNVHIDEREVLAKPAMEVLADAVKTYKVPDKEKFEILCRIRTAAALDKGRREDREKLLTARLLAIAIYCHTHAESRASSTLFVYEPDLIIHIAELLQVDNGVPVGVQTAAIAALDALARYRNKLQEVLTAVNAAINHGILMGLFRKTVNDLPHADSTIPQSFVDALLGFLTYIVSHQSGSSMVVGAGLVPLLIQLIENRSPTRLTTTSKTMQLLDNVLYSAPTGFHLFTTARGLDTLVERIEYEVDYDIQTYGDPKTVSSAEDVDIPIARIAVLKHMLRSMHRMMQSAGTAEGLRNLINMSLLKTVKKIIEYRGLFGPTILPFAINIMTTFVHNEPTSLTIIQEAGLPEAFYNTIEAGIEPAIEVIQAIPNAIGALCLNEVGQAQLAKRPSIIPAVFSLFTSERHLKVLNDKENAVLIGTAIDELIRHHPSLKAPVFSALKSALSRIEELGLEYVVPSNLTQWYQLRPVPSESASTGDAAMDIDEPTETKESSPEATEDDTVAEDENSKSHDSIIVSYLDVIGRFLEGLFQHTPHCRDFISITDGLNRLGRMTSLPCLPYDFANSVASDSMVQVMRTLAEVATNDTIQHLSKLVKESLDETADFWKTPSHESKLISLIDLADKDTAAANAKFRSLVTLHIRITLLSDVFSTTGYAHGRAAIGLLQTLMNNTSPDVIADLGTLHRASIWENIVFNAGLAAKNIDLASAPGGTQLEGGPEPLDLDTLDPEDTAPPAPASTTNGVQQLEQPAAAATTTTSSSSSPTPQPEPRVANAAAIKHITHGLPNILAPFFQAMVKTFHARRNPDSAQRKQIQESSKIVADIMLKHLQYDVGTDRTSSFAYYTVVLGLFSLLLIEERPTSTILHTIQLYAFYRIDGLDALFSTTKLFTDRIAEITNKPEDFRDDQDKKELVQAYGGLKVVLHLLQPTITAKYVVESGQSHLIVTRDKKDTDPDYFEPHHFLVKLRVAALPLLTSLWQSGWLLQAPVAVTRAVVRALLEVMKGEGEESKGDTPIIDAERALIRAGNNVNAATELLISHPFPLPPDPEPEPATPAAEGSGEASGSQGTPAEGQAAETTSTEAPAEDTDTMAAEPTEPAPSNNARQEPTGESVAEEQPSAEHRPPTRTTEEWRTILNQGRDALGSSLSRHGLTLIDEHQQLLFDLYPAFTKASPRQKEAIQQLVEDVKDFSPHAYDVQEQPMANRCRLLALILTDSPSAFDDDLRNTLMDNLLALLSSIAVENPPKWLAGHLLVIESLFILSDEPRAISIPREGEPIEPQPIAVGPCRQAAKQVVFKLCLRLLTLEELQSDELLSVLRLLVLFTRNREMADSLLQADALAQMFKRLKSSPVSGGSSYIATILRHLVEDSSTVKNIMQQNIKRYFSHPRTRVVEAGTYVKNCSSMALRDPELFIEATKSLCQLNQPYAIANHITLQPDRDSSKAAKEGEGSEMQVDNVASPPTPAIAPASIHVAESTVHLLITELISCVKDLNETPHPVEKPTAAPTSSDAAGLSPTDAPMQAASTTQSSTEKKSPSQEEIQDKYQYVFFVMQCLSELLLSYDSCKLAFLSYSPKKKLQTPAKEPGNRFRSGTLHFILNELLTFGTINLQQADNKLRNKIMLCSWATNMMIALCADTAAPNPSKDVSADLASVRKYVLEALGRAIKDLPSDDNLNSKYGRLLALSDLCNRLLTVRFDNMPPQRKPAETLTHIAKVMLEKNFVATLTASLSDVDLNYPHVRSLVTAILKPLQYLTKVAIKMSHSGKRHDKDDDSVMASSSSDEEEGFEEPREETPDLYRNSSLGMYTGEMDDGRYPQDEEMDEDAVDTDEDVDMEFGDETGSEDTSNTDDDDDEDEGDEEEEDEEDEDDEMEDEEQTSEWEEVEDDDEALVENEGEGEEDVGDASIVDEEEEIVDDDDEEPEGELAWEDAGEDRQGLEAIGDEFDEEEETGVPVQIIHEEDEGDMESDEGPLLDNGFFNMIPNFEQLMNAGHAGGFIVQRRHRGNLDEHVHLFGRPRNGPSSSPEAIVHPLLLNTSSHTRSLPGQSRSSRQAQRIIAAGTGAADLLQTLDGMIGPGGFQLVQQVMAPGSRGWQEAFRLDVPGFMNLDRGGMPPRRHGIFSTAIRVERAPPPSGHRHGREFEPLVTIQRWTEEAKILHGEFVAERVAKLVNHVILTLLPEAIEAAKKAKLLKEEEAARLGKEKEEKAKAEEAAKKAEEESAQKEAAMEAEPTRTPDPSPSIHADAPAPSAEATAQATTEAPSESTQDRPAADQPMSEEPRTDGDTEMVDVQTSEPAPEPSAAGTSTETTQPAEPAASTSAPVQRVTVMIHGNPVDITDTGIDPDFLEALPDDMREEVLNQHVRDQRAAQVERPADSQISNEFLDALPPEIRAEILQQEAIERARRQAEEAAPSRGPTEIDPASFIASLDPTLRQAVLMEQDDGFLATLPSHMIAEAEAYRDDLRPRRRLHRAAPPRSGPPGAQAQQSKPKAQHDAIQLLDKGGVAVLVRLLFFPKALRKSFLFRIFVNLCQNSKTRTELFNFLLSILQDGTGDLAAVDKSFAQMSVRSSKPQTPKSVSKQKPSPDYLAALSLPASQIEAFPDLVAKKCLDALTYIVTANPHASLFFLTEHELPAGLRKAPSKKGKGKEKQAPQSHYPIVLLLGLLDRKALLRTPAIMDSVVNLLASVTKPLTELKDRSESADASAPKDAQVEVAPATQQDSSPTQPTETSAPSSTTAPSSTPAATSEGPRPETSTAQQQSTAEPKIETVEEKVLLANPPQIPHAVLRLIVNILTVGECPAKTFQQSMNLIQHLSYISDARDVIAQELRTKAQEFGRVLIADLEQLMQTLQSENTDAMTSCISTKFSPASSTQAKLLRVLKTIEHMYSPKSSSATDEKKREQDIEKVQNIYESFNFSGLWRKLGDCLGLVGAKPETEHIATVLLPLIESLMVVCQHVGTKAGQSTTTTRAARGSMSPRAPTSAREAMEELFISFTDNHRKLLNLMVRNNPSLMSGSFSLLVNNPRVLDFDNKRNYFNQQLHKRPSDGREHRHTLQLNVRRARVFEDSFQHLQRKTGDQIKYGKLNVRFYDEEGVDAGGVTREWFQILARQMFDPNNALFQPCAADKQTYQPNKNSWVNPEHLSFFKFVGRVIGKAIFDGRLLDAYFARSLYRQLLGKPVDYKDVEWVDPEYYKSLCWILENDPTVLDLTFSVEADEFGVNRVIPLKEGGDQIPVTQENKREFVQLSAQYRLYSSIKEQIENLSAGFYEIVPKDLITIFNEQELELLISGTPDIDVDEWRAATDYVGYTSSDPNIVWWWRALKSFNRDERAKVLSFATGTSRVPLNGFTDLQGVQGVQRFSIHRAYGENDRLPQAHTCFNQIDLPQYSSYEMLRQQLLLAINEGGEGFAFS
ncbi:Huwe1 protein [Coprinopsis cinerea okayama7|uniref:HECT-type E3 ubiquitin transferase n=1 Tax=Coprinopsis cinerea (strain Okayama-7 / 130 / ATCC MYA-4618 / FGSC 9003) TaxID=240176 RepID=A8N5V6_COPC7|nr:Huwe1 protein [Coprinopsis cinerea okayama7\|eukprot:XP_001830251.2 Huwe1 protein [Coprinopsis cinerea okayama7\